MMRWLLFIATALCLLFHLSAPPSHAGLTTSDVVVVYNTWWELDGQSEAVADYYCTTRNVPACNKLGVSCPNITESMTSDEFVRYILNDQGSNPGLLSFLSLRAGVPIGTAPDLATDPTKAIVLCYGIPTRIGGRENTTSTEGWLSLLFNETPWGRGPVGAKYEKRCYKWL